MRTITKILVNMSEIWKGLCAHDHYNLYKAELNFTQFNLIYGCVNI